MRGYAVLLCLGAIVLPLIPAGAMIPVIADGFLGEWGNWNTSGETSFTASLHGAMGSTWSIEDDRGTWEKASASYHSGGEWYDIEGLYIRFRGPDLSTITGIDYAMLTSFRNTQPNDTNPFTRVTPVDSKDEYPDNYRMRYSPVIAFDLTDSTYPDGGPPPSPYDYALVLDSNSAHSSLYANEDASFAAIPQLYSAASPGWNQWVNAAPLESGGFGELYPIVNPADFITTAAPIASTGTGGRWRARTDATTYYDELNNTTWQQPDGSTRQNKNWVWEGSIDFASAPITVGTGALGVHFTQQCGNDWITLSGNRDLITPEPSLGLLLMLGIIPLGIGYKRRRR